MENIVITGTIVSNSYVSVYSESNSAPKWDLHPKPGLFHQDTTSPLLIRPNRHSAASKINIYICRHGQ